MHISDGVLSPAALTTGWVIAAAGTAVGLKKINPDKIIRVSLMGSAFFLASLVNVKVGPSCTHLSLLAPIGLVLGWSCFPAMMVALLLQALLFQFGGLLSIGPNTVDVGVPAFLAWLVFSRLILNSTVIKAMVWSFLAGALAVLLCATFVGCFLMLTDTGMIGSAKAVFIAHLPLAAIEGIITAFFTAFLKRSAPDLLLNSQSR